MQKYKRTQVNEEDLPVNPFLPFLNITANEVKQGLKHNGDDNKVLFDDARHCKIFISSDIRKHLNTLSGNAAQMFLWLAQETESGKDYMWINKLRYMEEHNIKSIKTVNAALIELDNKRFIDAIAGMKDVYFINPTIFFNGSRINKYPEAVRIARS